MYVCLSSAKSGYEMSPRWISEDPEVQELLLLKLKAEEDRIMYIGNGMH